MKRLIFVHGWGGNPKVLEGHEWIGPLKKECEEKGITFTAPEMPETESPDMNKWIPKLKETVGTLDNETYFVGHSIGCQTITRYLSTIQGEEKSGNIVFVAPWTHLDQQSIEEEGEESVKIVESWISVPIEWEKAKEHMGKVLAIFSDDDPYVPLSEKEIFEKELEANLIVKEKHEHFNEIKEIKEIMEFIQG